MAVSLECVNSIAARITVRLKPDTTASWDAPTIAIAAMPSSSLRDHRRDLDFDLRAILDQRADVDRGHRRVIDADDLAEHRTDLRAPDEVLALVGEIPRHPRDVLRSRASLGEHRLHVDQRLPNLADEIVGLELATFVPADLA